MDVRTVDIRQEPASSCTSVALDLLGQVGEPGYVRQMTTSLAQVIKFAHVSVLLFPRLNPPGLLGTGSTISPACAKDTATVYLSGHYNADPTARLRSTSADSTRHLYIQRQRADEIANADYRASCYEAPGIIDRLSIFQRFAADTWIAVNVYRDITQGYFDSCEYARLITVAPLLTAGADKHLQLVRNRDESSGATASLPAPSLQQRLAAIGPRLSTREFEVCSRILLGLSAKEIARQLGIAPNTVAEHRKNAYTKLSIRDHKQLFARLSS